MRVLVFSTDDHLHPAGGAEQAFGNITKRLAHIEFDLICAKLRKGVASYEQVGNVYIHRIGFGIPKVDGIILALVGHLYAYKLMRKHSYDLLWSIMATYGAFSALRVKKKTNIPFLLTLQEGDSFEYIYKKVRYVRGMFNAIFKNADSIQAISQYLLAWGKDMGYVGTLGKVIPNGVDIEAFTHRYSDAERTSTRASFGFPEDAVVLITSSRLEKKNGIEDVIQALRTLPEEVCFVVCGGGSREETIQQQIKEYGLAHRVRYMGFVEPHKLPLLLQSSDMFIRPSLSEGLGNAFLEAMASRTVVIGTHAGGIPDFLTDGITGFVVDIQNPESIVRAITHISTLSVDEKKKVLDTAEDMVRKRYNWDTVSRDMETLFDETVSCTQ